MFFIHDCRCCVINAFLYIISFIGYIGGVKTDWPNCMHVKCKYSENFLLHVFFLNIRLFY